MDAITTATAIGAGLAALKTGAAAWGARGPAVAAFLEKMSSAAGIATTPWQTRRNANADADAAVTKAQADAQIALIKAETDEKIKTLAGRAELRVNAEQERAQANLEAILVSAADNIREDAKSGQMDDDWLANFFEKARLFSDEEMQRLWAQVLAGEANAPGSFSRRTINALANLEKSEAELFRRVCSFCLVDGEGNALLIVRNVANKFRADDFYSHRGLFYGHILSLMEVGLITFESEGMSVAGSRFAFSYFGRQIIVEKNPNSNALSIGQVTLTRVGEELARICKPEIDNGFLEHIIASWQKQGHTVEVVIPAVS